MAENISNKDRLREITDGIEQGIKDLFESDRYMQYLRTMSRFHKYSVNNVMLIHMQKPDATLVAGFNKWRDQFERHVKKGARGIKIIAPTPLKKKQEREKIDPITQTPVLGRDGKVVTEEVEVQIPLFRPVTVFDVSQTEGKALPELAANLTGDVRQYEVFMEALRRASPVPISIETMAASMDGYFDPEHQDIAIRKGMSEVQTVSATVHEIAHSKLHNYEQERLAAAAGNEAKEPPKPKDRHTEEVEAESVSFAVCAYYGIETGENSFGYIASWSQGKELKELRASLDIINKTASGLITDIDRHFSEICKERGIDLTQPVAEAPAPEPQEGFYALDDTAYLHIQVSEEGYDYTLYDRQTWREIDGGQLDNPGLSLTAARDEILALHELTPKCVENAPLDILEEIQSDPALPPMLPQADTQPERSPEQTDILDELTAQGYDLRNIYVSGKPVDFTAPALSLADMRGLVRQMEYDAIPKLLYTSEQWAEIRRGMEAGLDVKQYTDPKIPAEDMAKLRGALERGLIIRTVPDEEAPAQPPAPEPVSASMLPDIREQALDEYPLPDTDLTVAELETCGYLDGDMLPLSRDRALELFEKDLTVYAIIDGGNAEMLFDRQEIDTQGPEALFAVSREEWEDSREFDSLIQDRLNHQGQREAAFLQSPVDAFAIYQMKHTDELRGVRYEPLSWLESKGVTPECSIYDLVYTGRFTTLHDIRDRLEELWDRFNNEHPADYHSPSMSVSDIVAIKQNGKVICHYCDSFDFVELPGFLSGKNPLRAVEDSAEQNDNQLDGIINNTPTPTVAELEAQVKAGGQISLLALARASHAEQSDKKKSVVEQLKKQPPQQERKKAAPNKSAEREI